MSHARIGLEIATRPPASCFHGTPPADGRPQGGQREPEHKSDMAQVMRTAAAHSLSQLCMESGRGARPVSSHRPALSCRALGVVCAVLVFMLAFAVPAYAAT